MLLKKIFSLILLSTVFFCGCDGYMFTPRSKKNIQREKPSIVLLNKIVDYREENNAWPVSKEAFTRSSPKYKDAFEGFPYAYVSFKIKDDNKMTLYFTDHIKDLKNNEQTKKVELNAYHGYVLFYKENGKFIWKIKMH